VAIPQEGGKGRMKANLGRHRLPSAVLGLIRGQFSSSCVLKISPLVWLGLGWGREHLGELSPAFKPLHFLCGASPQKSKRRAWIPSHYKDSECPWKEETGKRRRKEERKKERKKENKAKATWSTPAGRACLEPQEAIEWVGNHGRARSHYGWE